MEHADSIDIAEPLAEVWGGDLEKVIGLVGALIGEPESPTFFDPLYALLGCPLQIAFSNRRGLSCQAYIQLAESGKWHYVATYDTYLSP